MTLPEANRLCAYWRDHPPVHLLVAAALGVKPEAATSQQTSDLGALLRAAKGGVLSAADLTKLG